MNIFCDRCVEVYHSDTIPNHCENCGLTSALGVVHNSWVEYVTGDFEEEYRRELLYIQKIKYGDISNVWGTILCFLDENHMVMSQLGKWEEIEFSLFYLKDRFKLNEIHPDRLSDEYLIKQIK